MAYKKLTELALFNAHTPAEQESLKKTLTNSKLLKDSVIEPFKYKEQVDLIRKRFNYSSKVLILSMLEKEEILPVYNVNDLSIVNAIFTWLAAIDGKIKGISNMTMFGDVDQGFVNIDASRFFANLQAAAILLILHKKQKNVENNVTLLKELAFIYTRLWMKILDKDYAINSDKMQADKAAFCIAKFFLSYVVGKETNNANTVDGIAKYSVVNETSEDIIKKFEKEKGIIYDDFKEFIKCLAESLPALRNLTIRGFVQSYVRLLGSSALYTIESLQYFLVNIFSVYVGASLNNNTLISSVSGKHLDTAFNTFFGLAK